MSLGIRKRKTSALGALSIEKLPFHSKAHEGDDFTDPGNYESENLKLSEFLAPNGLLSIDLTRREVLQKSAS
jgi:hypothetical protein